MNSVVGTSHLSLGCKRIILLLRIVLRKNKILDNIQHCLLFKPVRCLQLIVHIHSRHSLVYPFFMRSITFDLFLCFYNLMILVNGCQNTEFNILPCVTNAPSLPSVFQSRHIKIDCEKNLSSFENMWKLPRQSRCSVTQNRYSRAGARDIAECRITVEKMFTALHCHDPRQ